MAYELHIHRGAFWADDATLDVDAISVDDWWRVVQDDDELVELNERAVTWTSPIDSQDYYFEFSDGSIDCRPGSAELVRKSRLIAMKLNAHLEGDDGERYD